MITIDVADKECKRKGARLATIDSPVEQKLVEKSFKNLKTHSVLTGMKRDNRNVNQFVTYSSRPIQYT